MLHLPSLRAVAAMAASVLLAACGPDDTASPGQTATPTSAERTTPASDRTDAATGDEADAAPDADADADAETIELRSGSDPVDLDEGRYEFVLDQRTITLSVPTATTAEAVGGEDGATHTLVLRDGGTTYATVRPVHQVDPGADGEATPAPAGIDGMEELLRDSDEVSGLERTTIGGHDALVFDVTDADGAPLVAAGEDATAGAAAEAERVRLLQTFYGSWWAVSTTLDDSGEPVHDLDVDDLVLA